MKMTPISIYLHIPFCTHRCGYCDFNTYAGIESLIPDYTTALCTEIQSVASASPPDLQVQTVFFGGGTPSLLPLKSIEDIIGQLNRSFNILSDAEISLEANPGTLSHEFLFGLFELGVNRISLGVQSANPDELRLLERIHDFPAAIQSAYWVRKAGFRQLNLDLIFGLPEQSLDAWQQSLKHALALHPEHLSLYALSLESGTPFGCWAARGLISTPDPDLSAEMYEWSSELLVGSGYAQYEISNWAKLSAGEQISATNSPAFACRHNLQYWRNLPYLGFGAGAHGYAAGARTANLLSPSAYIKQLGTIPEVKPPFPFSPANETSTSIDPQTEIGETMMMGLRLTREGISEEVFYNRFHTNLAEIFPEQIDRLIQWDLLEWASSHSRRVLRLTGRGRLLGNRVFAEFI